MSRFAITAAVLSQHRLAYAGDGDSGQCSCRVWADSYSQHQAEFVVRALFRTDNPNPEDLT